MACPMQVSVIGAVILSLGCLLPVEAFYIPGTYPKEFKQAESIGGEMASSSVTLTLPWRIDGSINR